MVKKCLIVGLIVFGVLLSGCSCKTWTSFWGGDPACECKNHWKSRSKTEMCAQRCLPACPTPCSVHVSN